MKRFAYGKDRQEADFVGLDYDRIFLDHDNDRSDRDCMVEDYLRSGTGDVIVLVGAGDLGKGNHMRAIKDKGVTVEVHERAPATPGPKPDMNPTPDQLKRLRRVWTGGLSQKSALERASDIMGFPVTRNNMNHHVCMRDGGPSTKEKNAKT